MWPKDTYVIRTLRTGNKSCKALPGLAGGLHIWRHTLTEIAIPGSLEKEMLFRNHFALKAAKACFSSRPETSSRSHCLADKTSRSTKRIILARHPKEHGVSAVGGCSASTTASHEHNNSGPAAGMEPKPSPKRKWLVTTSQADCSPPRLWADVSRSVFRHHSCLHDPSDNHTMPFWRPGN